jgi:hypothetical protein
LGTAKQRFLPNEGCASIERIKEFVAPEIEENAMPDSMLTSAFALPTLLDTRLIKHVQHTESVFLHSQHKETVVASKRKIIISLDSDLCSSIYSSIVLVRDNAKDPIDEVDLDNLVSQAVWKFFDRHRVSSPLKPMHIHPEPFSEVAPLSHRSPSPADHERFQKPDRIQP